MIVDPNDDTPAARAKPCWPVVLREGGVVAGALGGEGGGGGKYITFS